MPRGRPIHQRERGQAWRWPVLSLLVALATAGCEGSGSGSLLDYSFGADIATWFGDGDGASWLRSGAMPDFATQHYLDSQR